MLHTELDEGEVGASPFGIRLVERAGVVQTACSPRLRQSAICSAEGRHLGDLYGVILTRLQIPDVPSRSTRSG